MKKRMLVIFLILIQLTGILFAQKIEVIKEKVGGSRPTKKVEFIDKYDRVIKSINLIEENPYNKLNYDIDRTDKAGHNYYKSISYDDLFPDKSIFNSDKIEGINSVYAYPIVNVDSHLENYVIIIYTLATRIGEIFTGSITTIELYDSKGEKLKEINNITSGVGTVKITENGKYLAYLCGNDMGDQGVYKKKIGVRIFDLNNDSLILDRNAKKGFELLCPGPLNNMLVITMKDYKSDIIRHEIINFEKRKIYSIELTRNERNKLKERTNESYIFGLTSRINESEKILKYEKDFEVEDF